MSSEIAGIPPWKMALMERKRRNDKDNGSSVGRQEQSLDVNGLPSWKRDIIVKKHQQKNTLVFMAKLPSNSTYDFELDQSENLIDQPNSVPTFTNGCSESPEINKRHSSTQDYSQSAAGSEVSNTSFSSRDVSDCVKKGEIEDRPVEERLLPIRRNPILRLDIAKRHSSSGQSVRHSWSPRSGSDTFVGLEQPSLSEQTSPSVFPPVEAEDVFNTGDSDAEVAYGRGFVHKLLMKFSHLATSDQSVVGHVSPRQSASSQSRSSVGSPGKVTYADAESLPKKTSLLASRAKCHSVDDLWRDSDTHSLRSEHLDNTIDLPKNGDLDFVSSHENSNDSVARSFISARKMGAVEVKELPLTNIVSNTRSLFENLVTSPRQSNSVSHGGLHENILTSPRQSNAVSYGNLSNRLGSVDSVDKTNAKSVEIVAPVSSGLPKKEANRNGPDTRWSNQISSKQNSCDTEQTVVRDRNGVDCVNSDKADPGQLVTATKLQLKNDNGVTDQSTDYIKLPTSVNGYKVNGQNHISDVDAAGDVSTKFSFNSTVGLKSSTETENIKNGHVILGNSATSNNQDRFNSFASDNQVSSSIVAKARMDQSVSDTQNDIRTEDKSVGRSTTKSSAAKSAPSRPGMLLIRPASNLIAAKTKTEYLSLTKYNDVRKGEFAPAAKKSVEQIVDDESVADVEAPVSNSVADPSCDQRVVFSGAGVHLDRSLLDKTRQGHHLQLKFDDALTSTFEYPSEQSLMDSSPAQPGDCDFEPEVNINPSASTGLRTSPISGASAAALSSYRSRMQVDYQFGMHVNDERKPEPVLPKQKAEPVKSPEQENPMWSKGASADLLF